MINVVLNTSVGAYETTTDISSDKQRTLAPRGDSLAGLDQLSEKQCCIYIFFISLFILKWISLEISKDHSIEQFILQIYTLWEQPTNDSNNLQ